MGCIFFLSALRWMGNATGKGVIRLYVADHKKEAALLRLKICAASHKAQLPKGKPHKYHIMCGYPFQGNV